MAMVGTSIRRPVGAMPGMKIGISQSWVKLRTNSSTTWSVPIVREIGVIFVSAGHVPMKCRA